jgi:hypothetical protein
MVHVKFACQLYNGIRYKINIEILEYQKQNTLNHNRYDFHNRINIGYEIISLVRAQQRCFVCYQIRRHSVKQENAVYKRNVVYSVRAFYDVFQKRYQRNSDCRYYKSDNSICRSIEIYDLLYFLYIIFRQRLVQAEAYRAAYSQLREREHSENTRK